MTLISKCSLTEMPPTTAQSIQHTHEPSLFKFSYCPIPGAWSLQYTRKEMSLSTLSFLHFGS